MALTGWKALGQLLLNPRPKNHRFFYRSTTLAFLEHSRERGLLRSRLSYILVVFSRIRISALYHTHEKLRPITKTVDLKPSTDHMANSTGSVIHYSLTITAPPLHFSSIQAWLLPNLYKLDHALTSPYKKNKSTLIRWKDGRTTTRQQLVIATNRMFIGCSMYCRNCSGSCIWTFHSRLGLQECK